MGCALTIATAVAALVFGLLFGIGWLIAHKLFGAAPRA